MLIGLLTNLGFSPSPNHQIRAFGAAVLRQWRLPLRLPKPASRVSCGVAVGTGALCLRHWQNTASVAVGPQGSHSVPLSERGVITLPLFLVCLDCKHRWGGIFLKKKLLVSLQCCCNTGRLNNVFAILQQNHRGLPVLVGICHTATTLTFSYDQLFGKAPNVAWTTHLILPKAKAFRAAVSVIFKSRLAQEHYEIQKTKGNGGFNEHLCKSQHAAGPQRSAPLFKYAVFVLCKRN